MYSCQNPYVCTVVMSNSTPLDFVYIIDRWYSGGHIYIDTYTNTIKLLYYVDNYVLWIVAKCWAVLLIIFNKIDYYLWKNGVFYSNIK